LIPVITKRKIILNISKHCLMLYSSPQSLSVLLPFVGMVSEGRASVTRLLNK